MEWGNGGGGYIYSQNSILSQSYVGNELLQSSASYFVVNASNGAASLLLNKDNASLIQRNIANDADLLVNDEAQFAVNYPNGINGLFFNKTVSAFQQTNQVVTNYYLVTTTILLLLILMDLICKI